MNEKLKHKETMGVIAFFISILLVIKEVFF